MTENAQAGAIELSGEDQQVIDRLFTRPSLEVAVDRIRPVADPAMKAYRTLEEARANTLGCCPSPEELAQQIREGEMLKPIRLVPTTDSSGRYDYDLAEGRIRYWAWVIAFDGLVPIRAFVRED